MKITAVEPLLCHAYRCNWLFVKISTDAGIHGVGEGTLEYREETVATALREMERTLVGKDPRCIEALWHEQFRDVYFRGGPVYLSALSAVEMALWDILGKSLNTPVYQLLGGKVRETVPCYANGWFAGSKTPEDFARCARLTVEAGYAGLKWDPFGSTYLRISPREFHAALECVEAVHAEVKGRADLLIEGHGRFDIPAAVSIARELARFEVAWFEEPLPPGNLSALAEVKQRSPVPIAAGERLYSRWDWQDFFRLRPADFIQPDVTHVGGIAELKKIAAQAEANFLPVCPHNPSGPVANAATLQLAACIPNFYLLETMSTDVPWRSEITTESARVENGRMTIPDHPGLGIDLNLEAIGRHPPQPTELRHYKGTLTDIRPSDATSSFV